MSFPSLWCRQPTKDKLGAWNYSRRLHGDGLARVRAKLVEDLEKHRSQSFRWTCITRIFQKRASTKIACASTARRRRRSPHAQEPRSDGASARVCPIVRGVSKHGCCDRERVGREQTPTVDFAALVCPRERSDVRLCANLSSVHSRASGNPVLAEIWVPAFAGTNGGIRGAFFSQKRGGAPASASGEINESPGRRK